MSYNKIQSIVDEWVSCRKSTIATVRQCADRLESSHRKKAETEHSSAKVTLTGDAIGLCGVLVAPVSGGLSLGLCGVSAMTGVGTYLRNRGANQDDDMITKQADTDFKRALNEDKNATEKLKELYKNFTFLEQQLKIMKIEEELVNIQKTSCTELEITIGDFQRSNYAAQLQNTKNLHNPVKVVTTQVANFNAALTSAKEVVSYTRITEEAFKGTKSIKEVVSQAASINDISKAAQSLATAKKTAVLSIQASKSATKSVTMFASVAKGTNGVVKSVGAASSLSVTSKRAAEVINASEQVASVAKCVKKAAGAGMAITTATKGADTTIKTVKNIKQASNTVKTVTQVAKDADKAIRTTRLTTRATKVTKMTQSATKAASISKLGLAINAIVIPLDIYNLVVATDNLKKTPEDVKNIRAEANRLENEFEGFCKEIKVQIDVFTQLHVQLCKVYKDHNSANIFGYLQDMHKKIDFPLPSRF